MAPTLPHFVWVAGRDPVRGSVSSACPDLRRQAGSRRRQPLGRARALGWPGGAQDFECLFKIPRFITVVGDEQEDGVLCSANVRRPAGSPLISLRRAPHPPARQSLSVCMREYQHRLRQDGWVSDAVRSRRSPKGGGHERSYSPSHPGSCAGACDGSTCGLAGKVCRDL